MAAPASSSTPPSAFSIWVQAARPKTLWAGVTPVIVGTSLAWRDGLFHTALAVAALLGALALQVAANFANDLYDYKHGVDSEERIGPLRVTQAGLVTPTAMRNALVTTLAFAIVIGTYLVVRGGWPIVAIGLSSIIATILYTGGPRPYGHLGLGELFVFIFFGVLAVCGTYYVQALTLTTTAIVLSLPMGFLSVAVLVVNNLRDIDTDRRSGKRTLAVRLGRTGGRWEYVLMLMLAGLIPPAMVLLQLGGYGVLLGTAAILASTPLIRTVCWSIDGPVLNRALAATARLQLFYGLLVAVGINL
jgi:1,4-dihydroxy-2-naphthoate octaprenyltransferase